MHPSTLSITRNLMIFPKETENFRMKISLQLQEDYSHKKTRDQKEKNQVKKTYLSLGIPAPALAALINFAMVLAVPLAMLFSATIISTTTPSNRLVFAHTHFPRSTDDLDIISVTYSKQRHKSNTKASSNLPELVTIQAPDEESNNTSGFRMLTNPRNNCSLEEKGARIQEETLKLYSLRDDEWWMDECK